MKNVMLTIVLSLLSMFSISQTKFTHQDMASYEKGKFDAGDIESYVAKDGHEYKVGDTLKIGRPSSNKTFAYITMGAMAAALAGKLPEPLDVTSSGTNTIIKKIGIGGSKRMGYKIYVTGKGACGLCPNNNIDFEEALATGEIESKGMTRDKAIAKLKEAKELMDLGMMSKDEFEKLKTDLTKYISPSN